MCHVPPQPGWTGRFSGRVRRSRAGNIDGEPVQGSLAGRVADEVKLLRPRRVILGHHDDWLPGLSVATHTGPIRAAIETAAPATELVEMDYGAGYPVFAELPETGNR